MLGEAWEGCKNAAAVEEEVEEVRLVAEPVDPVDAEREEEREGGPRACDELILIGYADPPPVAAVAAVIDGDID